MAVRYQGVTPMGDLWTLLTTGCARVSFMLHLDIRMHVFLLGRKFKRIDHIDGNGLNNQRNNLRGCSHMENLRNRGATKASKSGFKGVWKRLTKDGSEHYVSQITVNYKCINVGYFHNLKDAVTAYNNAAIKYHGDFAKLNPIPI